MARKAKLTREEAESQIIQAARSLFAEHGYYASRIQDIAELSGMNKRVVYAFVPDKESLYLAVLSEVSREIESDLNEALMNESELCSRGAIGVYLWAFELFKQHTDYARLLMWERMGETLQGVRLLSTQKTLRTKIHNLALKAEGDANIDPFDAALDVLETQIALASAEDDESCAKIELLKDALLADR